LIGRARSSAWRATECQIESIVTQNTKVKEMSNWQKSNTMDKTSLWHLCLDHLQKEISQKEFYTWIGPLQAEEHNDRLLLFAPNPFVLDWISEQFLQRITQLAKEISQSNTFEVKLEIGSTQKISLPTVKQASPKNIFFNGNNLNDSFNFENFVEGKSNQLARSAALEVAQKPGTVYNPLLLYGGVGLGKTHLMHAVGNIIQVENPNSKIIYVHAEQFVAHMVLALQRNLMEAFKELYRHVDILLIDDIQFLAGKDRSQEEFFHTFNALFESYRQIVLSCDSYPKEVRGLEDRLRSRFSWGLSVTVQPPELKTRVAILMRKAEQSKINLPYEVAFFIAKRIQSNVRELEGALKRVIANAYFTGHPITLEFAKEALKDLLVIQAKLVSIENIQKTVAEYYKLEVADILSAKKDRFLARPRQIAMTLTKELTDHSLPEIGQAFGGRDHTTVLYACRKIKQLIAQEGETKENYMILLQTITT
jgi:chromosomal replication initiator protein